MAEDSPRQEKYPNLKRTNENGTGGRPKGAKARRPVCENCGQKMPIKRRKVKDG